MMDSVGILLPVVLLIYRECDASLDSGHSNTLSASVADELAMLRNVTSSLVCSSIHMYTAFVCQRVSKRSVTSHSTCERSVWIRQVFPAKSWF